MNESNGIIKTIKRDDPYARIANAALNDKRISYKARGILSYLISKPNNWETRIKDLYNNSPEGYASIRSGIAELLLTGYMELRNTYDGESSKFTGRFYVVREEPLILNGFRELANKNRCYDPMETILADNPLGNRKVFKSDFCKSQ